MRHPALLDGTASGMRYPSVKEICDEKARSDAHDLRIYSGVWLYSECPAKSRYSNRATASGFSFNPPPRPATKSTAAQWPGEPRHDGARRYDGSWPGHEWGRRYDGSGHDGARRYDGSGHDGARRHHGPL